MALIGEAGNDILHNESDLIMEQEFESLSIEMKAILTSLLLLFDHQADKGKQAKIGKYLLTNPNNTNMAKCMVTILGNSINEADIAMKLSKNPGVSYQSRIYSDKPWRLQQLQDCLNQIKNVDGLINGLDMECNVRSRRFVYNYLGEVMYHLKCAKDCLMMPKKRTLEELVKNPFNRCFNPSLPNEVVVSFYVQDCKLIMAIYHLCTNNTGRVDISNRHQTECIVPWLNDAISLLIFSLWKCQQLKDKFHTLELLEE